MALAQAKPGPSSVSLTTTKTEKKRNRAFFDVVCWAELAENMAELPTGFRVWFSGYQVMKEWEDKKSGQKRTSYELKASDGGVSMRWDALNIGGKKAAPSSREESGRSDPARIC
jgi:single-stranded DNA-binding protein